jgi:hypothetical protein
MHCQKDMDVPVDEGMIAYHGQNVSVMEIAPGFFVTKDGEDEVLIVQ